MSADGLKLPFPVSQKIGAAATALGVLSQCFPESARAVEEAASAAVVVGTPSDKDNALVRKAFSDYDARRFDAAEREFSQSISRWSQLHRSRDEVVSLLKARANVRIDSKHFNEALEDYDAAIALMSVDGERADGTATYPEYPDTFVGRGLAHEGLGEWEEALGQYDKAISLWGGDGNPFVLNYRGNVHAKLGDKRSAMADYKASADTFLRLKDIARYSEAQSNLALVIYDSGDEEGGVKIFKDVIRKNPGFADMHVALAAHNWGAGDYIGALNEWKFTCDAIDVGCENYKDTQWLREVRRWPQSLVTKLTDFQERKIPEKLKGSGTLAPGSHT